MLGCAEEPQKCLSIICHHTPQSLWHSSAIAVRPGQHHGVMAGWAGGTGGAGPTDAHRCQESLPSLGEMWGVLLVLH